MEFIHGTTLVYLKMRCWSGEKKSLTGQRYSFRRQRQTTATEIAGPGPEENISAQGSRSAAE